MTFTWYNRGTQKECLRGASTPVGRPNLKGRFDMAIVPHSPVDGVIYTITNTITATVYIGRTVNLSNRWSQHRSQLTEGKHFNRHLQRAWKKHGESVFVFAVLDRASTREALASAERAHVIAFRERGIELYNARHPDGAWLCAAPPVSQETRKRRSATMKRKGIKPSADASERARIASTGRVKSAKEIEARREKLLGRARTAKEKANISAATIGKPKTRTPKLEARWAARRDMPTQKEDPNQTRKRISAMTAHHPYVTFRGPDGMEYTTQNIAAFAREHGLHERLLAYVVSGKQRHHRGWVLVRQEKKF